MYSENRWTLAKFLNLSFTWALFQQCEDASIRGHLISMTKKSSRMELTQEFSKQIVDQPLSVWSALNKVGENGLTISNVAIKAKSPSEAWEVQNSLIEDEDSDQARDDAKKNFETLAMIVGESAREYVGRAKGLAN